MAIQSRGETLRCPCCFELCEDNVEDYVIPNRIGFASRGEDELCPNCDEWFSVEYLGKDEYEVEHVEDHVNEKD